jgi:lipopolysaccharide/colanic/teichoic acid biosynthesis glycosyltransferase
VDLTFSPDVAVQHWPAEPWERVVKASWERAAAALALVLLLPLLLVLVVAVRLDSGGPALFRQPRVGRGGRTFTLYKLRTMTVDAGERLAVLRPANEADGPLFKLRADPRITRIGGVLRKYSLDELPQLWNVLRGEMALIGPRPALPDEVSTYDEIAARRLAVKPGLTGLWQVSGRSDLPWHVAVRLDVHYVESWSLGLDLAILARTPRAVLGHRGAY